MLITRGITIAIVEDSAPLRKLLGTYFTTQGFNVVCEAENGQQMLDSMADTMSRPHRILPDLCLLDTNMPVMDGCATARRLQADYPSIQIMAYSFFDSKKSEASILNCGAHAVISKDASAEELRDALMQLFYRSRLPRPPAQSADMLQ